MLKFQAVCLILRRAGFNPPPTLDTGGTSITAEAERYLDEQTREILAEGGDGQFFNARENVELTPDGSGHVLLPSGTIMIRSDGADAWRKLTQLGDRLYDRDNNTDVFSGPVRVAYTSLWEFECAPEPIQKRIAMEAAMQFNDRYGRQEFKGQLFRDLSDARDRANFAHNRTSQENVFDAPDSIFVRGGRPRHPGDLIS